MKRIFIDSSVFYSAVYSARGYSRDLFLMAVRGEIVLVVSDFVLKEVRRNLAEAAPEILDVFDFMLELIPFELAAPSKEDVIEAAQHVVLKDAPIIAAAKISGVSMLVTLDKKHLLGKPEITVYAGMPVVTPQDAFATLR